MKFFLLLYMCFLPMLICAAACPTAPLQITSQDVIDNFATLYPGCTVIEVDLSIEGTDISNLHGLGHLTAFLGSVSIKETSITSLDGLSNIRLANSLELFTNDQLVSLNGLDSLDIGRLTIKNNALINDLSSLLTAHSIHNIDFSFNPSLTNLSGLDSLKRVETIFLSGNSFLTDVDGLKNIQVITGNCSFINNGNNRLPGFVSLDSIYGKLAVSKNKTLTNLRGLDSLTYIGEEIFIAENDGLLLLTGLENLDTAYRMIVSGNRKLINLRGLSSIKEITNELFISGNHSLTDLSGLDSIKTVGEDCTISGIHLISLNGLNHMDTIRGAFVLNYNYELTDASAIKDLEFIGGGFKLIRNDILQELPVFEKLVYIKGDILIQENANLITLHSFVNLRAIDGTLHISGNPLLNSLEGIDFINSGTIQNVEIHGNLSLSVCNVASLCYYFLLDRPFSIYDNEAGCNSMEEINAQCVVGTEDVNIEKIIFYPNPTEGNLHFRETIGTDNHISILTTQGTPVINWNFDDNQLDISKLPPGIYLIRFETNHAVKQGKVTKL